MMRPVNETSSAEHLPGDQLTLEEWAAMPEDDEGELVDGVLVEEEMPDLTHETVVAWLIHTLRSWLIPRRGFVFGSEAKFGVAPRRGRKPDLTVYLPGCPPLPRRGLVRVPPDVAIEIVSPTARDRRRDRSEKAGDYAAFGVRWYWLVDPERRTFDVLALADGAYRAVLAASGGLVERIPGCDGLALDLDALWAEIERLADVEPCDAEQ
jgi:Uma2 family endonuclease